MRILFTIPVANLGNAILSFGLLFFCIFNVYLSFLFAISGQVETETSQVAHTLSEDFLSGKTISEQPRAQTPTALRNANANVEILRKTSKANTSTPDTNITSSTCIPFNLASDFQPTTEYKQSTRLPLWMKEYFDWHRKQTSNINSCNFKDYKFLILRCASQDRRCGGVADRLKGIPMFIALAAKFKRVFLIRWQRPTKLEEFLLPNEIQWSFPDWLYEEDRFTDTIMQKSGRWLVKTLEKEASTRIFVEGHLQDFYGGSSTYYRFDTEMDANKTFDEDHAKEMGDLLGWSEYELIFRDLFFTLFEPTPEVARLIKDRMVSANLVPGKFSTSHYRAFYAIEHDKGVRSEVELKRKTRNAINCATTRQPGDPIYFASDSQLAVRYARNISESRGNMIVTFDNNQEALHLDKKDQWKSGNITDFYPTFVDLLIMGEAKCVSYGMGGFGLFANLLSHDPKCVVRHDARTNGSRERCEWTDPESNALW